MEPNVHKEMDDDGAQRRTNDEKMVEKARKRRHIEYCGNATIPITAHEKKEEMVITSPKEDDVKEVSSVNVETPPLSKQATDEADAISPLKEKQQISITVKPYPCKFCKLSFKSEKGLQHHNRDSHEEKPTTLANKIIKIVEPNENTKMDERGEHRNSDEESETSTFEDVATSESDGEKVAKKVKESRTRKHIEYYTNVRTHITVHEKTENMVITQENDRFVDADMKKVSSVNVGTLLLSKQATDKADAIGQSNKKQITIKPYPCKSCKRKFKSENGLQHHIRDCHAENPSKLANNTCAATSMKIVEPIENTKMDGGEHKSDNEDYETSSFKDVGTSESYNGEDVKKVEKARKRRHIEYDANATIPITAHEKKEEMVITPPKEDDVKEVSSVNVETPPLSKQATNEADAISPLKEKQQISITVKPYPCKFCKLSFKSEKGLQHHNRDSHEEKPTTLANKIIKIVEPNENTKMDEGGEHRNSDEDSETSTFEDVVTSESDGEKVANKVKESRKRKHIEYYTNVRIHINVHEKTENMVITPQENDKFVDADMKKVSSVNVGTLPLSKQATDNADAIGQSSKKQITIKPYSCKSCKRKFKSENGLQHHIRVSHAENPSKLANNTFAATSMKIVEPNENTKMDGGEHRSDNEDFEIGSFKDVGTSESYNGEDVKKVEKARKRRRIEYDAIATIPITAHEKKEEMVITPPKDDVKEVSSVNVETPPLSKQATVEADAISGPKEKQQITIAVKSYHCKSCKRSYRSENGLQHHIRNSHNERSSAVL